MLYTQRSGKHLQLQYLFHSRIKFVMYNSIAIILGELVYLMP